MVTRSGTVGRVIYVGQQLAGKLISDDLIHIRLEDETIRFYTYMMLKNTLGQHQLLRNEYGSVQTHLEPTHVRDVIVPMPENREVLEQLVDTLRESIAAREESWTLEDRAGCMFNDLMTIAESMLILELVLSRRSCAFSNWAVRTHHANRFTS